MKLAVLGAGAWGTALAVNFAQHHNVTLWARNAAQVAMMQADKCNTRYLPNVPLPSQLALSYDLNDSITQTDAIIVATPSGAFRSTLSQIADAIGTTPVIWVCKGFEAGTMKLPHQVADETLLPHTPRGALSGPSFAAEVAAGLPTALTLASEQPAALALASQLHNHHLRVYTSTDVIGVEVGGALKNVIAIAAGISDGLHFGYNARAALISRSLAEMTRLGHKLGGHTETFMGLTGMGDLILTATADLSRNRQVGLRLAAGMSLADILRDLGHIAEGVTTAHEVEQLAQQLGVDMPIVNAVCQILYQGVAPRTAVEALLNREPKAEVVG
ncbi:MAG: NAD(P)-dependent glycerol-3-phosphate dehydrogenase [Sulfuriferula sp.]|nr:NAD(P)-dependent glycerol-3-phosphate dehydrogenase [Sulfuriferula sp.]